MTNLNFSKTYKDLDGPKGKPIVGHIFDLEKDRLHLQYEDWAKEYGELYNLKFLNINVTVSTNPDTNAYIFKNRPNKFRRFKKLADVINEVGVDGVFTAEGESWKKQRKVTQKALDNKNVKAFFPSILTVADRLKNYWDTQVSKGDQLDYPLSKDFIRATVDVTTNLAFGYDMNTVENQTNDTQEHVEKIFPQLNKRVNSPIPLYKYFKTAEVKDFEESLKYIREHLGKFITQAEERLKNDPSLYENPSNFLEAMLASQDKDDPFTWDEIFGNLYTMLLAGEDTTSNSLTWTSYFLSKYPEVQEKIREEIRQVLGENGKIKSFEQIQQFQYTSAVFKEVTRLKPVTPNLYMQCLEDTVVNDVLFPKGHFIITQLSSAARSEEYFEKAKEFIPERWLKEKDEPVVGCPFHGHKKADAMKPFGGGPRLCPGKFLAEVESVVFLVTLMKDFEIEFYDKDLEVEELFAFTMQAKNLKLNFKKRHQVSDKLKGELNYSN
ncbi:cytochrome P450 [Flammeovirga agarivorans]|uniref:Cytochrome P450 n=1 Tax=Flammeovirga agarivorans TaxID=2726742 RepID=A0A7X8SM26_9BACT|nr:cytochrome P450 [Flammeovirga agarivorans]NLR92736.1 cytochrome P450 [Flammeovirga agarivorans]